MLYSTLETTPTLVKSKVTLSLTDYEAVLLKKDQAKQDLKLILLEVTGYEFDDTNFQNFLDLNESFLQEVLAFRQLYWYFTDNDLGEGSRNRELAKQFNLNYQNLIKKLPSMLSVSIPKSGTLRIYR